MDKKDISLVAEPQSLHESDADLVLQVTRRLVSRPDRVTSRIIIEGKAKVLLITVAREDWQNVFSNQGRTARSLRAIVQEIFRQSGQSIDFDLQPGEQE